MRSKTGNGDGEDFRARGSTSSAGDKCPSERDDAPGGGGGLKAGARGSEERPHHTRIGISLSGGGIRSATFCLGVYQCLADAGIDSRARYLSAVSGGSYLAAGLAITHALYPDGVGAEDPRPWTRGSPEEAHLRRNLSYLAPGLTGRLWMFANVLYGAALNLIPLILGAVLLGQVAGLGLRVLYPGVAGHGVVTLTSLPWVVASVLLLLVASLFVVGARRFQDKERIRRKVRRSRSERLVTILLATAAGIVFVALVLPGAVELLAKLTAGRIIPDLQLGSGSFIVRRVILGIATLLFAGAMGGTALWLLRLRRASRLRAALAGLGGFGVLFAPFLLAAQATAERGWSWKLDGLTWTVSMAVLLICAIFVHNRRYSMHLFYRERLQEAFACRRELYNGVVTATAVPYNERILLSGVAQRNAERAAAHGPKFPELIMCASVAARGDEVPNKTWAASFTFEGVRSGPRRLGLRTETEQFEDANWIGGGNLTLPAMMAISGAAVSPLMGRFTVPAFRFLMAILNIRLGVWITNPVWRGKRARPSEQTGARRVWRYLLRGWREPGAWYVLKEGLGLVSTRGRYIYVSDGGHWENLGLTELLRRRCTHIIVVDASSDPGLGDIGRAIGIARAELNAEVKLDPRPTAPDETGLAKSPVAVGTVRYADGQQADIFYARSVLWEKAPSDLHLLAQHSRRFPNHPTSNQFLSGELFDAYRALGWAVGAELVKTMRLPQERFDEPRMTWGELCAEGGGRWGRSGRPANGDRRGSSTLTPAPTTAATTTTAAATTTTTIEGLPP